MVRVRSGFVRDGVIVIEHPGVFPKEGPRSLGGEVIMQISGNKRTRDQLLASTRSVKTGLENTAEQNAAALQTILQTALDAEYKKTGTGRFARSIRVSAVKSEEKGKIRTSLQVKAITYRETKFLTNLGGQGYFTTFPVGPYRIFARGVTSSEGKNAQELHFGRKGSKFLAKVLRRGGGDVGRLKVPNRGAFYVAGRFNEIAEHPRGRILRTQRGGGESRFLKDRLGFMGEGDVGPLRYPLWVNHPGFRRDLLSDLVLQHGGTYQEGMVSVVKERVGKLTRQGGVRRAPTRILQKGLVASGSIPTGSSTREIEHRATVYLTRTR
jgi:hypothetical protein